MIFELIVDDSHMSVQYVFCNGASVCGRLEMACQLLLLLLLLFKPRFACCLWIQEGSLAALAVMLWTKCDTVKCPSL